MRLFGIVMLFVSMASSLVAQENRIDIVRPDAPELASFGDYDIGVRTLHIVDPERIDILNTVRGGENAVYDRSLTLEVWYPAQLAANQSAGGEYQAITRNPEITATLLGTAVRDAQPNRADARYPLVIISHGYPGNRFLISHLGENLASKGYVVASIDHTDSTYDDQQAFQSTLYNRPLDQRFVLDTLDNLSNDSSSFLNGLLDAQTTGVVGYSMGGYGLVNNLGGGYSDEIVASLLAPPNELLNQHATGNPDYRSNLDPRIKVGFAIAPWGMASGFWRSEDLAGIDVPTFYLAGDNDTVAGYEEGVRAIYEGAVNSDRYLLTFKNAGHNAGAPYPVPVEILNSEDTMGASHYTDPVWDNTRMNNIMDHFATVYFDHYLKQIEGRLSYLDVVPDGADAVYSVTRGQQNDDHTYWKGFGPNTAIGLKLERLQPGE
ncbi:MAG: dienelactone hydrolase [SAR86 cluster bacterium]|uniref:Dienelactone hydrolase n=1 Tax=SAR86 cluster bacterium TaxID=2030880 RepID=A0A2A4X0X7_9GAMM|nr:MAG: dienelactone hydrolase [SAR86 cluster bacterium]